MHDFWTNLTVGREPPVSGELPLFRPDVSRSASFSALSSIVLAVLLGSISAVGGRSPEELPLPNRDEFLSQAREKIKASNDLLTKYTFRLTETRKDLDGDGRTRKTTVKTYDVFPHPDEELTYRRLISNDGRSVSQKKLESQDRQYSKRLRNKQKAGSGPWKPSRRERMIQGVFGLFDYTIRGRERIGDYQTIVVDFEPKPGVEPPDRDLNLLKKFRGTAWINESDHEMVQLETELMDTVSFGFGIVARFYEGTRIYVKRCRVNDEIWLVEESRFKLVARVLLLKSLRFEVTNRYSDYQRCDVDTSVNFQGTR